MSLISLWCETPPLARPNPSFAGAAAGMRMPGLRFAPRTNYSYAHNEPGVTVTTWVAANREEKTLANRRPGGGRILAVVGLLILGLATALGLAACAPDQPPPEEAIVGQWVNPQGGVIYFYADKTGFIPGDEGQTPPIPSLKFSYFFQDEAHLGIEMDGQSPLVIEIKLKGDKMTWLNQANNVEYMYTRVK
jgi:hypothetical protein